MLKEYTLLFAKTINNKNLINFNKMSIFIKKFFGFDLKSKVLKNEENFIKNQQILKTDKTDKINQTILQTQNIESKLNSYGIPTNIKSGLLNYEDNIDENTLKNKLAHYLITNKLLENFNKYFEKNTDDIIMIVKTEEYNKLLENLFSIKDNNVLKLPKIDNKNSIIGLNNILTFKIDEQKFEANRTNLLKHLMNLLEKNNLISIKNY